MRGGKGYKKGKKDEGGNRRIPKFTAPDADQDFGRVIRMLGDRKVLCFCNDGSERVCRIRGALCKGPNKKKIEVGDLVLLSYREYENAERGPNGLAGLTMEGAAATANAAITASGRKDIADLLDKYEREHWGDIRYLPNIHKDLMPTSRTGLDGADIFEAKKEDDDESSISDEPSDDEIDISAI
jgi:initiation factor 1A